MQRAAAAPCDPDGPECLGELAELAGAEGLGGLDEPEGADVLEQLGGVLDGVDAGEPSGPDGLGDLEELAALSELSELGFLSAAAEAPQPAAEGGPPRRWVLLQPVKGLCNRLRAIVDAWILAEDLGRELVVCWKEQVRACNCPWERLFLPAAGLRWASAELLQREAALAAANDLLLVWGMVCNAAGKGEKKGLAFTMRLFNKVHRMQFGRGLAHLVDTSLPKWKELPRLKGCPFEQLPDFLQVDCICIRSCESFYPARRSRAELAPERSRCLNRLLPAPAVAERVRRLPAGTVSVHVRRTDHDKAILRSPDALFVRAMDERCAPGREVAPGVPFSHFFLATDDPQFEETLRRRYGGSLLTHAKRTLDRQAPEGIEDAFVDLLMLAQGAEVIGSCGSSFSSVAALFHQVPLHVLDAGEGDGAGAGPAAAGGGFREVQLLARDPSEDRGHFFLVGSWDDWKELTRLAPLGAGGAACRASVRVRQPPGTEEFQVVKDRDWEQRFHPSSDGREICGPDDGHGLNWKVQAAAGCRALQVLWDPSGQRSLSWKLLDGQGRELEALPQAGGLRDDGGFFLVGTWDQWASFTELEAIFEKAGTLYYRARVEVRPLGSVAFQIVRNRSWEQRFHPSKDGSRVLGPDGLHGANWQAQAPASCKWLQVSWEPRVRSVAWVFISLAGQEMSAVEAAQPARGPSARGPSARGPSASPLDAFGGPVFLVGSWDGFSGMEEFRPAATGSPLHRARVEIPWAPCYEEFQVLQNRSWRQRFHPSHEDDEEVVGPDDGQGICWQLRVPEACRWLEVCWDPRGSRSVSWRFLTASGVEVPPDPDSD